MTQTLNEKAEKIKKVINGTVEKSKETLREIIASNNKYMDAAMDSNKKIVDSIRKNLNEQEIDDSVSDTLKNAFGKSVELAEDSLDSILNSYTRQMELTVDFNTKLVDTLMETNVTNIDNVLQLIHDNFERSKQLTTESTKELLDFYNKHTNLALNFNKKFEESINAQMDAMFQIQSKGLDKFTSWASAWWKTPSTDK